MAKASVRARAIGDVSIGGGEGGGEEADAEAEADGAGAVELQAPPPIPKRRPNKAAKRVRSWRALTFMAGLGLYARIL